MQYYVIGEREIVIAFKMVGIDGSVAVNQEEARTEFQKITGYSSKDFSGTANTSDSSGVPITVANRPRVLILTEDIASLLKDEVLNWQMTGNFPLLVEIPGLQGHIEGRPTLTDAIREAIGIQV